MLDTKQEISDFIQSQPESKKADLETLHHHLLKILPNCKLWFLNGRNAENKIVSNPNIGYGQQFIKYANGKTREFYQIGLSPNSTGISIYIIGLEDSNYLSKTYAEELGKAKISGYCIKFKSLKDINLKTLEKVILDGFRQTSKLIS